MWPLTAFRIVSSLLLLGTVEASAPEATEARSDINWIDNPKLRNQALARDLVKPRHFEVSLNDPPRLRWAKVYSDPLFANASQDIRNYLSRYIPHWAIPLLVKVGSLLRKAFPEYGEEMEGVAHALHMDIGDVVIVNLIYQLEGVGEHDCWVMNTTGPCNTTANSGHGPGLCTSLVAEDAKGWIWHGRNMDWNLNSNLLKYVVDVDFTMDGKSLYTGTLVCGMVGLLHGVRYDGFSISLNARYDGGNVLLNMLTLILRGHSMTPTHLIRKTLEAASSFDDAISMTQTTRLVDPVYFIVAGCSHGQGAIITRDRKGGLNERVWFMNNTEDPGNGNAQPAWYKLQTNYENNERPPSWDDRRTPGKQLLEKLGHTAVTASSILQIMKTWPTLNQNTDITAVMSPCAFNVGMWTNGIWQALPSAQRENRALYV